jgi:glycosyltransferase involved in cell wall biosynthesis
MKKITLCICLYNAENHIERCLVSFLDYLTPQTEVVLVNDGSTDSSISIIKALTKCYPMIRLINHNINLGLSIARKTAIDNVKTTHFMFIDADDIFITNPFSYFFKNSQTNDFDIVEFGVVAESDGFLYKTQIEKSILTGKEILQTHFKSKGKINTLFYAKIFKKSLFIPPLFYGDLRIYEDSLWMPVVFSRANKIFITNEILIQYNSTPGSITKSKKSVDLICDIGRDFISNYLNILNQEIIDLETYIDYKTHFMSQLSSFSSYSRTLKFIEFYLNIKGLRQLLPLNPFMKKYILKSKIRYRFLFYLFGDFLTYTFIYFIYKFAYLFKIAQRKQFENY